MSSSKASSDAMGYAEARDFGLAVTTRLLSMMLNTDSSLYRGHLTRFIDGTFPPIIVYRGRCGNGVCEFGEPKSECPSDCPGWLPRLSPVREGYWRSSEAFEVFRCPGGALACNGTGVALATWPGPQISGCMLGHTSRACGECSTGFTKAPPGHCELCEGMPWAFLRFILVSLFLLCFARLMGELLLRPVRQWSVELAERGAPANESEKQEHHILAKGAAVLSSRDWLFQVCVRA